VCGKQKKKRGDTKVLTPFFFFLAKKKKDIRLALLEGGPEKTYSVLKLKLKQSAKIVCLSSKKTSAQNTFVSVP